MHVGRNCVVGRIGEAKNEGEQARDRDEGISNEREKERERERERKLKKKQKMRRDERILDLSFIEQSQR